MLRAQRRASCGNLNEARFHAQSLPCDFLRRANLFACRQAVQHIRERFRMHETMFDGHVEHLHQLRMAFFGPFEGMLDGLIEFFSKALVVTLNFLARGPIFRSVGWQAPANAVDTERKELIEGCMEGS